MCAMSCVWRFPIANDVHRVPCTILAHNDALPHRGFPPVNRPSRFACSHSFHSRSKNLRDFDHSASDRYPCARARCCPPIRLLYTWIRTPFVPLRIVTKPRHDEQRRRWRRAHGRLQVERRTESRPTKDRGATSTVSRGLRVRTQFESGRSLSNTSRTRRALCVRVEPIDDKEEYVYYEPKDEVEGILREFSRRKGGDLLYEVRLFGDKTKQVSDSGKGSDNAQ
jgi:hypothetical protein